MELNCKKALILLNDCKGMAKNDDWIVPIGTENFDNHPIDNIK